MHLGRRVVVVQEVYAGSQDAGTCCPVFKTVKLQMKLTDYCIGMIKIKFSSVSVHKFY